LFDNVKVKFFNLLKIAVLSIIIVLILLQYLGAGLGLLAGLIFSLTFGNPIQIYSQKWAELLLKISVVGLGFGLDLTMFWGTLIDSAWLTIFTIVTSLFIGLLLGRLLRVHDKLSFLIASGSAICGGSAIAAISPTIQAKQEQTVVALAIVFILNGLALYLFPIIGSYLELTQLQFGTWAALAIHDTSSVVGAASIYGEEALKIATITKLMRALWIIPLVLVASLYMRKAQGAQQNTTIAIPYFIFLFILASAATTFIPVIQTFNASLVSIAKICLVVSLFFMGLGFSKQLLRSLDAKPVIQAAILWLIISVISLLVILKTL